MPNYVSFDFTDPFHHQVFSAFLLGVANRNPDLRGETNNVVETMDKGGKFVLSREMVSTLKSLITQVIFEVQDKETEDNMNALHVVNGTLSMALFT